MAISLLKFTRIWCGYIGSIVQCHHTLTTDIKLKTANDHIYKIKPRGDNYKVSVSCIDYTVPNLTYQNVIQHSLYQLPSHNKGKVCSLPHRTYPATHPPKDVQTPLCPLLAFFLMLRPMTYILLLACEWEGSGVLSEGVSDTSGERVLRARGIISCVGWRLRNILWLGGGGGWMDHNHCHERHQWCL